MLIQIVWKGQTIHYRIDHLKSMDHKKHFSENLTKLLTNDIIIKAFFFFFFL